MPRLHSKVAIRRDWHTPLADLRNSLLDTLTKDVLASERSLNALDILIEQRRDFGTRKTSAREIQVVHFLSDVTTTKPPLQNNPHTGTYFK